ncbi:putative CRISPR-associated protein [metagenome]
MIQIATVGDTQIVVKEGLKKIVPEKLYIIHTENERSKTEIAEEIDKAKQTKNNERVHFLKSKQYEDNAKQLKKEIQSEYHIPVELLVTEKFESNGVIRAILSTISKEKSQNPKLDKKDFVINITGGTKAMVAGAACAAYLAQAKMYYVLHPDEAKGKELVRELPVPSRAENTTSGSTTKTSALVIEKIRELEPTNNKHLLEKLSTEKVEMIKIDPKTKKKKKVFKKFTGQILSYHIKKLVEAGLITSERGWKKGKKTDYKLNTIKLTETGKHYADYPDVIGEVL